MPALEKRTLATGSSSGSKAAIAVLHVDEDPAIPSCVTGVELLPPAAAASLGLAVKNAAIEAFLLPASRQGATSGSTELG